MRFVSLAGVVVAMLSACLLPSPASAAAPKILRVGNGAEPQTLDPQQTAGVPETNIVLALLEGLVMETVDGKIGPGAAERWEASADGLIYTFHLRHDGRWSDGKPVVAEDFVRSCQRMLAPSMGSECATYWAPVVGAEDYHSGKLKDFSRTGFVAVDPSTLELHLAHPAPYFLRLLTWAYLFPVPTHVIAKYGDLLMRGNPWIEAGHYIGNGPYTLAAWKPNQKISLVRSVTYWDRANVKLDGIEFYPIDNIEAEERMFRTGQLDITANIPTNKIASYAREMPESLHVDPFAGIHWYIFNTQRAPFTDVRVRRALSLAIDRESLTKHVFLGNQQPAYNIVPPGLDDYSSQPLFHADIPEARRLLAAAGYPGGKGFPAVEILYNSSSLHRVVAESIQQMWAKNLGVTVNLINQEWKVFLDTRKVRNFQVTRAGWISDITHIYLEIWETGNINNDAGWSNATYDRLLHDSLSAPSDAARSVLYRRMEQLLVDEAPVMPICFYTQPRLINPRVLHYRTLLDDSFPWKSVDLKP